MTAVETWSELKAVAVGPAPHRRIGYVAGVDRVWVSNSGGGSLTVLDGTTGDHVATIEVGRAPEHVAVDETTLLGYVALAGADAIAVVDARTNHLVETIALPKGSRPSCLTEAFERRRLYAANSGAATVAVIETQSNEIVGSIAVGKEPVWAYRAPHLAAGEQPAWGERRPELRQPMKLYVTNAGSNDVSVIDEATGTVVATVPVGRRPERNRVYPGRAEMWIANAADDTLSVIDVRTDTVVATVPVGAGPLRMGTSEMKDGRDEVWVLTRGTAAQPEGQVDAIRGATRAVTHRVPAGKRPSNWVFRPGVSHWFVTSATEPVLTIVDMARAAVVNQVQLSRLPEADPSFPNGVNLAFSKAGRMFIVSDDDTVTVLAESRPQAAPASRPGGVL
jgi:YVTN family beta-propeller protein